MSALSIEHSSAAYRPDDIVYGMVAAGVVGWRAMEYGLQLFALLVAFPAFWLWGVWMGMALTLGVLSVYLAYSVVNRQLGCGAGG
jgi:hypothetical protein